MYIDENARRNPASIKAIFRSAVFIVAISLPHFLAEHSKARIAVRKRNLIFRLAVLQNKQKLAKHLANICSI